MLNKKNIMRRVLRIEYTGACRYTGYIARTIKLHLECGHTSSRKASQGIPEKALCRECTRDSIQQENTQTNPNANPTKQGHYS